ncbi:MAG: hypothetical protein ACYDC3_15605 [Candidatus Binataceae bacterium]
MNEMNEQLEACLASYLDDVSRYLTKQRPNPKLVPTPAAIRFWFEECEELPSWRVLTDAATRYFQKEHLRRLDPDGWNRAKLGNWFRGWGYYSSLAHGEAIDGAALYASLIADASAENWRLTTLAIIDDWGFGTERLSYTDFEIIRFEKDELLRILSADLNRIFFPGSVTNVDRLYKRWFIKVEESQKADRFHNAPIRFAAREIRKMISIPHELQYSTFSYTGLPEPIERALSVLTLWPWGSYPSELEHSGEFTEAIASRLKVPLMIQISDDPFLSPPISPPVDRLNSPLTPDLIELFGDDLEEDSFGGNVEAFDEFIDLQQMRILAIRRNHEWEFIDRGLRLFAKALMSTDEFEGSIWCMISLEALLGPDDHRSVGATLKRRTGVLYAQAVRVPPPPDKSPAQAPDKSPFEKVYQLRNELVHGSFNSRAEDRIILSNAIMLARRVAVRVVHLASEVLKAVSTGELGELPSRKQLLRGLDCICDARETKDYSRLSTLDLRIAAVLETSSEGQ